jgi:hypothetical protein
MTLTTTTATSSTTMTNNNNRSVARTVTNLGNTCFMNAILQALAHAPELLLAMDCESHRCGCPIAAENDVKRQQQQKQQPQQRKKLSPSASPEQLPPLSDNVVMAAAVTKKQGTRKSKRNNNNNGNNINNANNSAIGGTSGGGKSPDTGGGGGGGNDSSSNASGDIQYCTLCEVEKHIAAVHDMTKRDTPVAPSTFVDGFIDHVAPWFQLGVQEDSHEFLRLLIDAMQKSCLVRRRKSSPNLFFVSLPCCLLTMSLGFSRCRSFYTAPESSSAREPSRYRSRQCDFFGWRVGRC